MKSEHSIIEAQLASYEDIASEYYDQVRHPTCVNFREASGRILREWLKRPDTKRGKICEVGAGDSLLAELLCDMGEELHGVIISDQSPSMLNFSMKWADSGVGLVLFPANTIRASAESLDLLVSSLGDPYNEPAFWDEAYRVLRPGGKVFFTTPAYDWAESFRLKSDHIEMMAAEFELRSGGIVLVPSWIYPIVKQVALIKSSGIEVEEVVQVPRSALKSENLSPKLFVNHRDINIVTGLRCTKPQVR